MRFSLIFLIFLYKSHQMIRHLLRFGFTTYNRYSGAILIAHKQRRYLGK